VKGSYVTSVIGQNNRSSGFHRVVERQSDPIGRKERRGGGCVFESVSKQFVFCYGQGVELRKQEGKGGGLKNERFYF
jgi:hypothetical protein